MISEDYNAHIQRNCQSGNHNAHKILKVCTGVHLEIFNMGTNVPPTSKNGDIGGKKWVPKISKQNQDFIVKQLHFKNICIVKVNH